MIPWPDTWVYLFAGDEDAAHGMDADGGELRLAPFGDTYVLVSVLFSSLGMAFRFAEIEYVTKVSARRRPVPRPRSIPFAAVSFWDFFPFSFWNRLLLSRRCFDPWGKDPNFVTVTR